MLRTLLALLGFLFFCGLPVRAADLMVMPVSIHLDKQRDRGIVQVTNQGTETATLQAEAIAWRREGGVDHDGPTTDLILNPPVFTLAPGKTQLVRVGLRRSSEAEQETTYRLVLREVPTANEAQSTGVQGQVRVLVALRLPVYVAPAAVRSEQRWQVRYDGSNQMVAQVVNTGNVHYKVGALRVLNDPQAPTVVAQGPESVLFPGETRSFRLQRPALPANAANSPLMLEVITDRGSQQVALGVVGP